MDTFVRRHIGPNEYDERDMLEVLGFKSMDDFIEAAVPGNIRFTGPTRFEHIPDQGMGEMEALHALRDIAKQNQHRIKSFIGQGYNDCITPPVIQRNMLENAGWYTA